MNKTCRYFNDILSWYFSLDMKLYKVNYCRVDTHDAVNLIKSAESTISDTILSYFGCLIWKPTSITCLVISGYFCENGTVVPAVCPVGHFCPEGTRFGQEFPCPSGTFGNTTGTRNCFLNFFFLYKA